MDEVIDLIAYWFGEVTDAERDRIEAALMSDPALLAEYFGLKRHFEQGGGDGPSRGVQMRLEAELFDVHVRARWRPQLTGWARWAGAGLVAAATIAGLWLWMRPGGVPSAGTLVDTARPRAESGHTL